MDATRAAYLRERVEQVYSSIATAPQARQPFVTGRTLAANVGYPQHQLDQLPATASASFAGVAAVGCFAQIKPGATVLDLGCGAGLDSLLAAPRAGPTGQVIGVDFSAPMVQRAEQNADKVGAANVRGICGDAERLPLANGSIDTTLINVIFNLNPARTAIFAELARVMRPSGAVYAAEIVLRHPLAPAVVAQETNWFAWIAGAKESGAFLDEFRTAGFQSVTLLRTARNLRTKNRQVVVAEICAIR